MRGVTTRIPRCPRPVVCDDFNRVTRVKDTEMKNLPRLRRRCLFRGPVPAFRTAEYARCIQNPVANADDDHDDTTVTYREQESRLNGYYSVPCSVATRPDEYFRTIEVKQKKKPVGTRRPETGPMARITEWRILQISRSCYLFVAIDALVHGGRGGAARCSGRTNTNDEFNNGFIDFALYTLETVNGRENPNLTCNTKLNAALGAKFSSRPMCPSRVDGIVSRTRSKTKPVATYRRRAHTDCLRACVRRVGRVRAFPRTKAAAAAASERFMPEGQLIRKKVPAATAAAVTVLAAAAVVAVVMVVVVEVAVATVAITAVVGVTRRRRLAAVAIAYLLL